MRLLKIRPSSIIIDREYQRNLDENRAKSMAEKLDLSRIGVPVVSKRKNETFVALDGQHRIIALKLAEVDDPIYCEVHEGLTVVEEAALFLKLNGGRKAVSVFDKWRARLVAKEPIALEITRIIEGQGLRIAQATAKNCICAIQVVESVHLRRGNLQRTLQVLKRWSDGVTSGVFEGEMIKAMAAFLGEYPNANNDELARKLSPLAPERVMNRIKRMQDAADDVPRAVAAISVLRDIYNHKSRNKLPPPKMVSQRLPNGAGVIEQQAAASH